MPRTAPTVDDTPNVRTVSIRLIDASGDKRAVSFEIGIAETAADIEALVADYATQTNANIYAVHVSDQYTSAALASDATQAEENSVYDNIVLLAKSATGDTEELFVAAPLRGLFVGDTDNPDPLDTDLLDLISKFEAIVSGSKTVVSARFTERREKNQSVSF
jgi:hypothetical protein